MELVKETGSHHLKDEQDPLSRQIVKTNLPSTSMTGAPIMNNEFDAENSLNQDMPPSMDPRVHFDKTTSKWQFEDDDGRGYEWIDTVQAWAPLIDEEQFAEQQAAYKVKGVDENVSEIKKTTPKDKKYLKEERRNEAKRKRALEISSANSAQRNTAIYVTRLPLDVTPEELQQCFSRAGLILVDDENKPKIKLYTDPSTGTFNGSALVVFLKSESVDLAIRLFDETSLRLGAPTNQDNMQVSRAEFSHKQKSNGNNEEGSNNKIFNVDKKEFQQRQKRAKKVEKLKSKLEWDSEDEASKINENPKFLKVAVLKHMFTIEELESDPSLLIDLKEDVREECELLGNVTNLEPEGVMTVKFKEPIAAQACVVKMNNRFFAGRQVKAFIYDGKCRYKKSTGTNFSEHEAGGEEDEKKRLEAFAKFLEEQ
ncbi:hypothetical protein BY996DRAFT_2216789 [Phakopsora pachyrhizi]|nr:hypothetical protein BY996DRAFT_2216789 [Phakopsora pachyrhizi]